MSESNSRLKNVGSSNYSEFSIQPWDIWKEYDLNPWDADIVKRVLRTKEIEGKTEEESRMEDYEKIIHICQHMIEKIEGEIEVRRLKNSISGQTTQNSQFSLGTSGRKNSISGMFAQELGEKLDKLFEDSLEEQNLDTLIEGDELIVISDYPYSSAVICGDRIKVVKVDSANFTYKTEKSKVEFYASLSDWKDNFRRP